MKTLVLLFTTLLFTYVFAAEPVPAGCTQSANFSAAAYQVWLAESVTVSASPDATTSTAVPVGQRVELTLHPQTSEYSGFVNFEILQAGTYVIVSDFYPRMNVTDILSAEIIDPIDYGKITDCGTVNKALRFEFASPRKLLFEVVNRKSANLNILIIRLF